MPAFPYESLPTPPQPSPRPWLALFGMYFRKQIRRKSVIILLLIANIPTVVGAVFLYLMGQGKLHGGPFSEVIPTIELGLARPFVDSFLLSAAILAAVVGPAALAGERRAGATHFHIIRPMSAWEFLFGHWLVVAVILLFSTFVPLTMLFLFARLVISPELLAALPWIGLLRIMAFSFLVSGFMGLIVISLSAAGNSRRGVTMLWLLLYFGTDIMGGIARGTGLGGKFARCISVPEDLEQISSLVLENQIRHSDCGYGAVIVLGFLVLLSVLGLIRGIRHIADV